MTNILRLTPAGEIIPGQPPGDVVALLAKLADRAKNGEIKGVAIAWVDGGVNGNADWAPGCATGAILAHAVDRLHHRINRAIDEDQS